MDVIVNSTLDQEEIWKAGDIIKIGQKCGVLSVSPSGRAKVIHLGTGRPMLAEGVKIISFDGIDDLKKKVISLSTRSDYVKHYSILEWELELVKKEDGGNSQWIL